MGTTEAWRKLGTQRKASAGGDKAARKEKAKRESKNIQNIRARELTGGETLLAFSSVEKCHESFRQSVPALLTPHPPRTRQLLSLVSFTSSGLVGNPGYCPGWWHARGYRQRDKSTFSLLFRNSWSKCHLPQNVAAYNSSQRACITRHSPRGLCTTGGGAG